jgi:hypothetical protein
MKISQYIRQAQYKKGFVSPLLLALIVLLLIGGGVYVYQQTKQADWKTYTNDKYGFEMRYPNEWYSFVANSYAPTTPTGQEETVFFSSRNRVGDTGFKSLSDQEISIDRQNGSYYADSKTVDDFWNKLGKYDSKGSLVNKFDEKRTISGEDFILFHQLEWQRDAQKYLWIPQAVFMHSGNIFWVRPSGNVDTSVFNTVLMTFKFIQ